MLLALAAAAWAADAGPRKIFPYSYSQEDLRNGLRIVTIPTDYPNIVALYIVVQTGSRNEVEPGHTGFAHLFEHMMFRGTEKFPPEKYEQALKNAGAASNAYTSDDLTVYHTTFSKEDLEGMLCHGGRPLPESEVFRSRLSHRNAGRARRVQQEQREPHQQALRSFSRTPPSTATPTSTPPWASSRTSRTCPTSTSTA